MSGARGFRGHVAPLGVDLAALIAFVLVGMRSHHEVTGLDLFARNAVPLCLAWCLTAGLLGTYAKPGLSPMVRNWLVAVPVGLVARSIWVGSPTGGEFVVFLAVGMTFTLLFLLIGRGLVAVVTRRRQRV
jgi:hypothetical protein